MPLKLNNIEVIDAEIDGIDMADFPDCVDAYFSEAKFKGTKIELTDNELAELHEQNADEFYQLLQDEVFSIADRY